MEVGSMKPGEANTGAQLSRTGTQENTLPKKPEAAGVSVDSGQTDKVADTQGDKAERKKSKAEVEVTIEAVNKFLEYMTADLHFKIHEKTNRVMVQLVSGKDQRVLREYPPKEYLDMIANISEAIGIFLDRKL